MEGRTESWGKETGGGEVVVDEWAVLGGVQRVCDSCRVDEGLSGVQVYRQAF